jgi:two-component system, OmpR family, response regulator AdeR
LQTIKVSSRGYFVSGKRIFVVEDVVDGANILEAYLRRDGFDVTWAEDGQRGLDLYKSWKPDLIPLDVMLPCLGGTEVLAAIRRSGDTPVIMVTAIGDEPEKLGALRYGADDYRENQFCNRWMRSMVSSG